MFIGLFIGDFESSWNIILILGIIIGIEYVKMSGNYDKVINGYCVDGVYYEFSCKEIYCVLLNISVKLCVILEKYNGKILVDCEMIKKYWCILCVSYGIVIVGCNVLIDC